MKPAKWLTGILFPALFITMLLQGCENDLNKVKQISSLEINSPVETTTGVDVIYSDSAKVKARMITPLMLRHNTANPYYEMPKGIKMTFFDTKYKGKDTKEICTITSDYAITSNNDKVFEFRKNVVVSNTAGDIFRSEELIYDQNKKLIYSNQKCQLNRADGTALNGTSFKSNEDFTDYRFEQGKGDIVTKGNMLQ